MGGHCNTALTLVENKWIRGGVKFRPGAHPLAPPLRVAVYLERNGRDA